MKPWALPFTHRGWFVRGSPLTARSSARRSVTFISEEVRGENSPKAEAPLRVFNESLQV